MGDDLLTHLQDTFRENKKRMGKKKTMSRRRMSDKEYDENREWLEQVSKEYDKTKKNQ